MFIPLRSDTPVRRLPYVNYALIAFCCLLHLWTAAGGSAWRQTLMLWPLEPKLPQFVTYQFLHGDIMHLAGNMLFLWVFGNAVNSKMGNVVYALFYLASGVLAGVGFVLADGVNPCLGASGAIAAVTTAYLVLFPRSEITVFYLFFFIGVININALWFIFGKIILWDNLIAMQIESGAGRGFTNVAYSAHIAGYLAGFVIALIMLWLRALPRDTFDLLSIWRRAYQRRLFADAMSDPVVQAQAQYGRVARVEPAAVAAPLARPVDIHAGRREAIAAAVSREDWPVALNGYLELIAIDPGQVLSQRQQLEIANQLAAQQLYPQAVAAYETLLKNYPAAANLDQVRLMLGILYARYLKDPDRARRHLNDCLPLLSNPSHRSQAQHWLEAIGGIAPTTQ